VGGVVADVQSMNRPRASAHSRVLLIMTVASTDKEKVPGPASSGAPRMSRRVLSYLGCPESMQPPPNKALQRTLDPHPFFAAVKNAAASSAAELRRYVRLNVALD